MSDIKRVLSSLLTLGITSEERAINVDELANRVGLNINELSISLSELIKLGHVKKIFFKGRECFYLTNTGIIAACSIYS
ncbi:MAG: hypothetical protein RMJ31_04350 [Nitrososphaerota archaeon]|nr:hypothetical protein [Nitrososphaerota archaeon]